MLYQNMDREKVREFGSLSGLSVKTPRYSEAMWMTCITVSRMNRQR